MSTSARATVLTDLLALNALPDHQHVTRHGQPFTVGVPIAKGLCADASALIALAPNGGALPCQIRTLDRWSDGSLRWALVDLQVDVPGEAIPVARLCVASAPRPPAPAMPVRRDEGRLTIDTGAGRLTASRTGPLLSVSAGEASDAHLSLEVTMASGERGAFAIRTLDVEESGPLRSVLHLRGQTVLGGRPRLGVSLRVHAFAGHRAFRCDVTLRNPRAARHPNGQWDLGDAGSVFIRSASLRWRLEHGPTAEPWCSPEPHAGCDCLELPFLLDQDSSGGDRWRSTNHVNRHREVPLRFQGYRLTSGARTRSGRRATPIAGLGDGAGALAVAAEYFWQNFPKAIESDGRDLLFHLFPPQTSEVHEIQGGEQKTHSVHFLAGADSITPVPLDWVRRPIVVRADPGYYAATGAVPYLTPERDDPHPDYVALARSAIDGPDTFDRKREEIDEYGWRHFGDIYGDHEAVFHKGPEPLVSHYNNQYDPIAGFACQFMRAGDAAWWRHMRELAWHVTDIDIYHTDEDKPAYNRGLFWHTIHHYDADTATHRTYPRSCGHGGGPASEQNYAWGLMLAWLLTGEAPFREAALDLAQYPIRIDDGGSTPLRWLSRSDTGLATCSGSPTYHGPGRGSGNSLSALVDGHRLTGERQYLDKAEQIIRRAVHPHGDIAAQDLLDAERRWFYTMFLQALGKYLAHKEERGERDRMYAWGQASLLHYARWMADREYPYLDKPEILEFPTETWAAQDMRKCEVFHHAARHASDARERERFRERATFFFRASVDRLGAFPTRHYARPVVILLSAGWMHAWCLAHPDDLASPAPAPAEGFGQPEPFVPQRVRALRRAKGLMAAAALGLLALALAGALG